MALRMKRSFDAMNQSDDDEPSMGRQTLPVARLPADFEGVPTDGLQYLFTVRRDAKQLPHFTRVVNPYESPAEPKEVLVDGEQLSEVSPGKTASNMPAEAWRTMFLKRFKNLRKNCSQPIIGVQGLPQNGGQTGKKLMPGKIERDNWWAFIAGQQECVWNAAKKPKVTSRRGQLDYGRRQGSMRAWESEERNAYDGLRSYEYGEACGSYSDVKQEPNDDQGAFVVNEYGEVTSSYHASSNALASLPTPSATPQPGCHADEPDISSTKPIPRQPTPTLLSAMDNRYCLHLLMYFTYWIDMHLKQPHPRSSHVTRTHARWMFALLSRVDDHLTGDEMSLLRNLTRSCISLIKDLRRNPLDYEPNALTTPEPVDEKSCWIVVSAVVDLWAQRDLWEDAESALLGD